MSSSWSDEITLEIVQWFPSASSVVQVSLTCQRWWRVIEARYWITPCGRSFHRLSISQGALRPRTCHTTTMHGNGMLVVYGGMPETNTIRRVNGDMCHLDVRSRTWLNPQGVATSLPPALSEHSACLHEASDTLIIFGGYEADRGRQNSTYLVHNASSITTRTELVEVDPTQSVPTQRSAHSAVLVQDTDTMYVFGGWERVVPKNDLWTFHLPSKSWQCLCQGDDTTKGPSPRRAHVSFYLSGILWVFSGCGRDNAHNDILSDTSRAHGWACLDDHGVMGWRAVPCLGDRPCPRSRARGDVSHGQYYLLGGWDLSAYFNDLYEARTVTQDDFITSLLWRRIDCCNIPHGIVQHTVLAWRGLLFVVGGYKSRLISTQCGIQALSMEEVAFAQDTGEDSQEEWPDEEHGLWDGIGSSTTDSEEEVDTTGWVTGEVEVYPISRVVRSLPSIGIGKAK